MRPGGDGGWGGIGLMIVVAKVVSGRKKVETEYCTVGAVGGYWREALGKENREEKELKAPR